MHGLFLSLCVFICICIYTLLFVRPLVAEKGATRLSCFRRKSALWCEAFILREFFSLFFIPLFGLACFLSISPSLLLFFPLNLSPFSFPFLFFCWAMNLATCISILFSSSSFRDFCFAFFFFFFLSLRHVCDSHFLIAQLLRNRVYTFFRFSI